MDTTIFGVNVARIATGNGKPETLGHAFGECVAGKGMRIQRHEKIAAIIATKCDERGTDYTRRVILWAGGKT
jgi:hypothetical protein